MRTTIDSRRRGGPRRVMPTMAWAAALLAAGCALQPPAASTAADEGKSGVLYTERGPGGVPLDVLVVFDEDGRLIGTRSAPADDPPH